MVAKVWFPFCLLLLFLPVNVSALQGEAPLEDVMRALLWSSDPQEVRRAQERLQNDESLQHLDRDQFSRLEVLLRAGPPDLPPPPDRVGEEYPIQQWSVRTAEGQIEVLVELPAGYHHGRAWPLLLAMHGGPPQRPEQAAAGARRMLRVWKEAARQAGWIVAAPAMTTVTAVDRYTAQRLPYEVFHPDQARAVIEEVGRHLRVDPNRIVSTGISLGSNFSIAYAAAHPDWWAAIVPVSTEGDSRELLLRNLQTVPVYVLEGSRDANIREIDGPRALRDILVSLGADLVYREFSDRAHEGFQEHYDDVLGWLDARPRRNFPRSVLRVPHPGIMPLSRRVHWVESATRQGLIRAEVSGPQRIEITAWRTPRVRIFLHDRLVNLDQPVEIRVNGRTVFEVQIDRSLSPACLGGENDFFGDGGFRSFFPPRRPIWAACLRLEVPYDETSAQAGRQLAESLQPSYPQGRLSFWEMYAMRSLKERFPRLGFEGSEADFPPELHGLPEQKAVLVTRVEEGPWAQAGLQTGDLLLEVDGEPFFSGGGLEQLYAWLLRELHGRPTVYPFRYLRQGQPQESEVTLQLGPYAQQSPAPQPTRRPPLIAFDHYHSVEEIDAYLEAVNGRYPELTNLLEIGRSRAGRPLLALEIRNPASGPDSEKPAFYLDGNIHGGEALSAEGALYFIQHLLSGYGEDDEIRKLVDRQVFYVVPLVNPDGRAISIDTPENHRWNLRPVDEDGDGRMDEDPPEDLDGDGRILNMRVPDPQGRWRISPDDPRLMVRRERDDPGGEGCYNLYPEGLDNDGDGRFNEDRLGGVDINRNFPANWHPAQFASGPYPLSEPESRALVEYITSRPNIAAVHTYHTSGGLLLRFPTLADQDWDFPESDLQDYRAIAEEGVPLTGYDNYAYEKQKIVDLMKPGHGVFNDWASSVFGVFAMTTEMWKNAVGQGQKALLEWNDQVLGGRGFIAWKPFEHPQLGAVELGGWDRWSIASPPESMIEKELERNNRWVMTFARKLPQVAILSASAQASGAGLVDIQAEVTNVGWMPTATSYASEVLRTARPVQVRLELSNAELVDGSAQESLGVLPGNREGSPAARQLDWMVRLLDPAQPAWAEIEVSSEKAGTVRRRLSLEPADH